MKSKWNSNSLPSNQIPVFDHSLHSHNFGYSFLTRVVSLAPLLPTLPLHVTSRDSLFQPNQIPWLLSSIPNPSPPESSFSFGFFLNLSRGSVFFCLFLSFSSPLPCSRAFERHPVSGGVWCFLLLIPEFSFRNYFCGEFGDVRINLRSVVGFGFWIRDFVWVFQLCLIGTTKR